MAPLAGLLVGLVVGAVSPELGVSAAVWLGIFVGWAGGLFLAIVDYRVLRHLGEEPAHWVLAFVSPWAYLLGRAMCRRPAPWTTWAAFGLCVVLTLLSFPLAKPLTSSVLTANSVFDRDRVQRDIAEEIRRQSGVSVTVSCPKDPPLSAGSTFRCVAEGEGDRIFVVVTMEDDSGSYTWMTL
ncbi:DUF4333 domain-containing protein [Frankia sp. Mgl5]|uniref:DUF4333 domain-containing protein n=1 Tax=Frankia sp. Mgl5 TaxID=2933793 RepID=UPI00200CA2E5|nr:DUF4333 domain-containing protein [Frankia sp. Mgl5]MCK9925851.1 DUF4333 domain-containing protein [Frankia sp. Mgl5]